MPGAVGYAMSRSTPTHPSTQTAAQASTVALRRRARRLPGAERLAHRACNTRKGAVKPIVAWSPELFVVEPAPIVATVERLTRKGGREVVARCLTRADAEKASAWLLDRLSRFAPGLAVTTQVEAGGGQFLLVLRAL